MPPNESPIVTTIFEKGASSGRERMIFLLYVKEFSALCMYVYMVVFWENWGF